MYVVILFWHSPETDLAGTSGRTVEQHEEVFRVFFSFRRSGSQSAAAGDGYSGTIPVLIMEVR
jgi:hypothetical protein